MHDNAINRTIHTRSNIDGLISNFNITFASCEQLRCNDGTECFMHFSMYMYSQFKTITTQPHVSLILLLLHRLTSTGLSANYKLILTTLVKQTYETKFRFTDVTTLPKISNLLKFTESVDRRRRHVVITTSKSKTIEEFQQH